MAKRCGFCDFATEDATDFAAHMRTTHGWGVPAGLPSPMAVSVVPSGEPRVAKFCGNCGAARDALSTHFCRNCGAKFVDSEYSLHDRTFVSTTPGQPAGLAFAPKAGFWIRTLAYIIDIIATAILGGIVGFFLGLAGVAAKMSQDNINTFANVLGGVIGVGYFLYFWSRFGHGQTIGMRGLKLRVIRTDGGDVSIPRAFLRWIGFNVGLLALFLGVIWVGIDAAKQGWHDKLADTYVVRVE